MITDATARRQRWLSPFIVFPNIGAAAVNAAVAAGAGLTLAASRAAARAGVPLADLAAGTAGRIATRATDALKASSDLVAGGIRAAAGQPAPVSAHALLSRTLIEEPLKASAWPILAVLDAVGAATDTSPSMAAAATAQLSRALSFVSLPGVIPGEHGAVAAARTRTAFVVTAAGSAQAVFRSVRGIGGGLLALGVGDSAWIAQGLKDFLASAEHVHDKHANDGLERGAAPPVSQALAKISAEVIEQFPRRFVHAMEHEGLARASREYAANQSAVNRMLPLYLAFTVRMLSDVAAFVGKGLVDAPDAQKVALCELAIMESALADDERDAALAEVRRTASRAILEFEQPRAVDLRRGHEGRLRAVDQRRGVQPARVPLAVPRRGAGARGEPPRNIPQVRTRDGAADRRAPALSDRPRGGRRADARRPAAGAGNRGDSRRPAARTRTRRRRRRNQDARPEAGARPGRPDRRIPARGPPGAEAGRAMNARREVS